MAVASPGAWVRPGTPPGQIRRVDRESGSRAGGADRGRSTIRRTPTYGRTCCRANVTLRGAVATGPDPDVVAGPAVDDVAAGAGPDDVALWRPAVEDVGSGPAAQHVMAIAAVQPVAAYRRRTGRPVPSPPSQVVASIATLDDVGARVAPLEHVVVGVARRSRRRRPTPLEVASPGQAVHDVAGVGLRISVSGPGVPGKSAANAVAGQRQGRQQGKPAADRLTRRSWGVGGASLDLRMQSVPISRRVNSTRWAPRVMVARATGLVCKATVRRAGIPAGCGRLRGAPTHHPSRNRGASRRAIGLPPDDLQVARAATEPRPRSGPPPSRSRPSEARDRRITAPRPLVVEAEVGDTAPDTQGHRRAPRPPRTGRCWRPRRW